MYSHFHSVRYFFYRYFFSCLSFSCFLFLSLLYTVQCTYINKTWVRLPTRMSVWNTSKQMKQIICKRVWRDRYMKKKRMKHECEIKREEWTLARYWPAKCGAHIEMLCKRIDKKPKSNAENVELVTIRI